MSLIRTKGGALPDALQYSQAQRLTDLMPSFGNDLISAYCPFLSPSRMPGVSGPGQEIVTLTPFVARRSAAGKFPEGRGHGAEFVEVNGAVAADTTTGVLSMKTPPLDKNSFGIAAMFYLSPAAFNGTTDVIFGNDESGGATTLHRVARTGAGTYEGSITWDGITNSYYGNDSLALLNSKILEPGWHQVTVDRHAGQAGVRVNSKPLNVAPQTANPPTLSSTIFGGATLTAQSDGLFLALAVFCDGPLAQDDDRQADWEKAVAVVQNAIQV